MNDEPEQYDARQAAVIAARKCLANGMALDAAQQAVEAIYGYTLPLHTLASLKGNITRWGSHERQRAAVSKHDAWEESDAVVTPTVMVTASDNLRNAIIAHHPRIMRALEAQGRTVVW